MADIALQNVTKRFKGQAVLDDVSLQVADGETLGSVVGRLAKIHGEKFAELVFDGEGRIRSTLLVVLDGEQARGNKDNLEMAGVKGLMLMTPIAGG